VNGPGITRPRRRLIVRSSTKATRISEQTAMGIISGPPPSMMVHTLFVGIGSTSSALALPSGVTVTAGSSAACTASNAVQSAARQPIHNRPSRSHRRGLPIRVVFSVISYYSVHVQNPKSEPRNSSLSPLADSGGKASSSSRAFSTYWESGNVSINSA